MEIWLVPSAFFPSRGGVEELTLQLARVYAQRGHSVRVIVHRHPADLPAIDTVEGVEVRRINMDLPGARPGRLLRYPLTLRAQVRALEAIGPSPDLIHVQCASNQVVPVAGFAGGKKIPLVLTTQGEVTMDSTAVYDRSMQMRMSLRFGARRAAALTACSRRAGDDAAGVAEEFKDCTVIPNGVDPDQWTVTPIPAAPIYAAWGRHVSQKGFDLLIRAFHRVRQVIPGARLLIGGDGPAHDELRSIAGAGVEFLGPLDRSGVRMLLESARIAVVPSRLEPFGIVGVEAMAAGRTVVWSTNGGLRDATGGLGYGVDPTDSDALARAMIEAHRDPVDPHVARRHAESLSWGSIADTYLDLYEQARSSA